MTNKTTRNTGIIALTLEVAQLLLLVPSVAQARETRESGGERSFSTQRIIAGTARVRIEGVLNCTAGAENNGEPCVLSIKENRTGKTYQLAGENTAAMRLFQSGSKNVAVEGILADAQTVTVKNTSAQ